MIVYDSLYGTVLEYANGTSIYYPRSWLGRLFWRLGQRKETRHGV